MNQILFLAYVYLKEQGISDGAQNKKGEVSK